MAEAASGAPHVLLVVARFYEDIADAMIAGAAWFHLRHGQRYQWDLDVVPNLRLG